MRTTAPHIVDATLREGTQARGVRFGLSESAEIARALVHIGVDMVECGHPQIGDAERVRVEAVVRVCGSVPVLAHARARPDDVESVKRAGAQWVGIFVPVHERARASRLQPGCAVLTMIRDAVACAKANGLCVRFTVEDGSRTPIPELVEAFGTALEAGADRICLADTVGVLCPWDVEKLVATLRDALSAPCIEVHFHDDRGMAAANALTAVRAGATWISASVNGIGERCGITDTIALVANLAALDLRPSPDGTSLQRCSAIVQAHSRVMVDPLRPVVGRNAFTHVAKLHRDAVAKDVWAYSWTQPETVGRTTETVPERVDERLDRFVNRPPIISATELPYHRHGPGDRFVMIDERIVEDARQYCIVRLIPESSDLGPGHVDAHRHSVDSLFLFLGSREGLTGLEVEVSLADRVFRVESPASVFIPAGVMHSYRVVSGAGLFVNHVLAGRYALSLLELPDARVLPVVATAFES